MNNDNRNGTETLSVSFQRMIQALARLQAKIQPGLPSSFYIYDLVEQHTVYTSCSVAEMLNYTPVQIQEMGLGGLANLIHPDDLELVSDHYQRFHILLDGEITSIQYRMLRADGRWVWLQSQETPLVHAIDGFPLQLLGVVQDLTSLSLSLLDVPTDIRDRADRKLSIGKPAISRATRMRLRNVS